MDVAFDAAIDKRAVLRELMEQYGQDVWNFVYALTRDADLSDDVSQDVFVKAYQKMDGFRGDASVKTWLLTIASNKVTDARRSAFFRRVKLVGTWREVLVLHAQQELATAEMVLKHKLDPVASQGWEQFTMLDAKTRLPLTYVFQEAGKSEWRDTYQYRYENDYAKVFTPPSELTFTERDVRHVLTSEEITEQNQNMSTDEQTDPTMWPKHSSEDY